MPRMAAVSETVSGLITFWLDSDAASYTDDPPGSSAEIALALMPCPLNSTTTWSGRVTWPGITRAKSSSSDCGFLTMPVTVRVTPPKVQLLPTRRWKSEATPLVTATWLALLGYAPLTRVSSGPPNGPCGSWACRLNVWMVPGTVSAWVSITSVGPKCCCTAAMSAANLAGDPENTAASCAVPSTPDGLAGVVVATAAPMKVAATAAVIRAKISSCCRHSCRSRRTAQRMTARRAGSPPLATRRPSVAVLIDPAPGPPAPAGIPGLPPGWSGR